MSAEAEARAFPWDRHLRRYGSAVLIIDRDPIDPEYGQIRVIELEKVQYDQCLPRRTV